MLRAIARRGRSWAISDCCSAAGLFPSRDDRETAGAVPGPGPPRCQPAEFRWAATGGAPTAEWRHLPRGGPCGGGGRGATWPGPDWPHIPTGRAGSTPLAARNFWGRAAPPKADSAAAAAPASPHAAFAEPASAPPEPTTNLASHLGLTRPPAAHAAPDFFPPSPELFSPVADAAASASAGAGAAAAAGIAAAGLSELAGLRSPWLNVSVFMDLIHGAKVGLDLPWWGAIAATTVVLRLLLLPLMAYQISESQKIARAKPELDKLQARYLASAAAPTAPGAMTPAAYTNEATAIMDKHGANPQAMLPPIFIQGLVFGSMFFAVQDLARVPSFATGGTLWFTNLAVADPYCILPIATSVAFLAMIEMGSVEVSGGTAMNPVMKWVMRGIAVGFAPLTYTMPSGVFVFWTTANVLSVLQSQAMRVPAVKRALGIPEPPVSRSALEQAQLNKLTPDKLFRAKPAGKK